MPRYYLYADAEIVGPLSADDLKQAGPFSTGTLVCEADAGGRRADQWRGIEEIPELASYVHEGEGATDFSIAPSLSLRGYEPGSEDEFLFEHLMPLSLEEELLESDIDEAIESGASWSSRFLPKRGAGPTRGMSPFETSAMPELETPPEQDIAEPTPEAVESPISPVELPPIQEKAPEEEAPPQTGKFAAAHSLEAFEAPETFETEAVPIIEPPVTRPKFGPAKPLSAGIEGEMVAEPEQAPLEEAAAPFFPAEAEAVPPQAPAAPMESLFAPPRPPVQVAPEPPAPPAAAPAPPPFEFRSIQEKSQFFAQPPAPPAPAEAVGASVESSAAQPEPRGFETPGAIFGFPSPRNAPAPASPFGAAPSFAAPAPPVVQETGAIVAVPPVQTDEVIARLAKPEPTKSVPIKPKRRPPTFLWIAAGCVVVLALAFFVFFHNPSSLPTLMNAGEAPAPQGSVFPQPPAAQAPSAETTPQPVQPQNATPTETPAVPTQGSVPQTQQAQAPQAEPAQAPQTQTAAPASAAGAAPQQPQAATPASAAQADAAGAQAVDLVKNYPLDGERKTVGEWLQYSFTADPNENNKEEWTPGAVDANTYLVQYRVVPGPNSHLSQPISYVFEADLANGTVMGKNQAAKDLLSGVSVPNDDVSPARRKVPIKPKEDDSSKPDAGAQ